MMWQDRRLLAALVEPPYRSGQLSSAKRKQRRKALANLRYSLWGVVTGTVWLTGLLSPPVIVWVACSWLIVMASYDLSAWIRSRPRRKAAGLS